ATDGIHLGLGDGTFQAPRAGLGLPALPPGESITAMIGGDFQGDGKLDLAVAVSSNLSRQGGKDPGGVFVLLGNGDGTFRSPTFDSVGDDPVALVAGDFSGDGKLDLAVADKGDLARGRGPGVTGDVRLLIGRGDGTFQPGPSYPAGN